MPYKVKMPQINMIVKGDEDSILETLARKYNLPKASIARGFLRIGMEMFDQNPEKILALAKVGEC